LGSAAPGDGSIEFLTAERDSFLDTPVFDQDVSAG